MSTFADSTGRSTFPSATTPSEMPNARARHRRGGARSRFIGPGNGKGRRHSPALLSLPVVMPGLVPGIHVPPPPRPHPARTAMPQDVDVRNKSGHDGGGNQGETGDGDGRCRRAEIRASTRAIRRKPACAQALRLAGKIKPDSSGTSPGMTVEVSRRGPPVPSGSLYKPKKYPEQTFFFESALDRDHFQPIFLICGK